MDPKQLESQKLNAKRPDTAARLYAQLTATALDFHALKAPQDWLDELAELARQVRKMLPPTTGLPSGTPDKLLDEIKHNLPRLGLKLKSPARTQLEDLERQELLVQHFDRLMLIRTNVWFDIKLESVDLVRYRKRRAKQVQILGNRLKAIEKLIPDPVQSLRIGREFLKMMAFWWQVENPSSEQDSQPPRPAGDEQDTEQCSVAIEHVHPHKRPLATVQDHNHSVDVVTEFLALEARARHYSEQQDRVIFLWKEPVLKVDPNEEHEIRARLLELVKDFTFPTGPH